MRYFEIPTMNISLFETENVVTLASDTAALTNEQEMENELKTAIGNGNPGDGRQTADNIFRFDY